MFVGGAFVRSESGPLLPGAERARARGRRSRHRQRPARLAQGRARRGARREERVGRLGEAHRVQPRADPLSPRRGDGVASPGAHAVARARRPERRRGRGRGRRVDRSRRCSTPASPTSSSRCSRRRTRWRVRTSTSACPSRWARSAWSRRIVRRCSGSCRRSCRSSRAATPCVALASERDPRTAIVWSECIATSDMPGGVINILTGHAKELVAAHREAPRGHRHRRVDRRRRSPQGGRERGRRQREAREDARPDGPRSVDRRAQGAGPGLDRALPRDEDHLAPRRALANQFFERKPEARKFLWSAVRIGAMLVRTCSPAIRKIPCFRFPSKSDRGGDGVGEREGAVVEGSADDGALDVGDRRERREVREGADAA